MKIRGIILVFVMIFAVSGVSGCSKDSYEDYNTPSIKNDIKVNDEQSTPTAPAAEKVNFVEYTAADSSTIRSIIQELIAESEDEAFKKAAGDILDTYEKRYVEGKAVSNLSDSARQKARDEAVEHLYELNESGFENAPAALVNATFSEIEATVLLNYVSFFDNSTAPNTQAKADNGSNQTTATPTQNTQAKTETDNRVLRAIEITDEAEQASAGINPISEFSRMGISYSIVNKHVLYEGYYLWKGRMVDGKPNGYCEFVEAIKGDVVCNGTAQTRQKAMADMGKNRVGGYFSNGKLNGMGFLVSEEMTVTGFFVDGVLQDDLAILTVGDGKYEGYIKDGKPHGKGIYEYNGTTWRGEFVDGEFVCGNMRHEGYYYWGYFENFTLQGLGSVDDRNENNGNVGVFYYGEFKDSQLVEVLYIDEWTEEEIAAWRVNKAENDRWAAQIKSKAIARIAGMGSSSSSNVASIYAESNARVEKFKNDLAKNQPPDRIYSVPTYGTSAEERSVGNKWSYIIGK